MALRRHRLVRAGWKRIARRRMGSAYANLRRSMQVIKPKLAQLPSYVCRGVCPIAGGFAYRRKGSESPHSVSPNPGPSWRSDFLGPDLPVTRRGTLYCPQLGPADSDLRRDVPSHDMQRQHDSEDPSTEENKKQETRDRRARVLVAMSRLFFPLGPKYWTNVRGDKLASRPAECTAT